MARLARFPVLPCVLAAAVAVVPLTRAQTATLGGVTFTNKGLVGVGRMPAAQRDKFGETFGSLSGLTLDLRTWQRNANGSYSGTLYGQPDRGYTKASATTNYRARRNKLTLSFLPDSVGSTKQTQLDLTLSDTTLYTESTGAPLTSYDPSATATATRTGFPKLPVAFNTLVSIDPEGIVVLADGTFFVCEEYGPYIYRFSATGVMLGAIRPPEALIPKRNNADSFSSDSPGAGQPNASPSQPTSGRENNKGLEGLSLSADGRTLYALMQAATRQDGGAGGAGQSRFTRLLAYDITTPASPVLTGEWVLPLPLYTDGNNVQQVAEQHEIVALNSRQFLVLATDGNGRGATITASLYRKVLVFDTTGATNIAGTSVDNAATPLAQNGVLATNLTPATSVALVDLNDAAQLAKFSLNNSATSTSDTLASKWESLALAPALDPAAPDDFFLLVGNDNDFSTNDGFQDGASYNASPNIDTMILAYRVTLPGANFVPFIVSQPAAQNVATGSTFVFSAAATGSPAPTFQWRKDGVNISGATGATLVVPNASASSAGAYSVVATNSASSATSSAATLTVTSTTNPGHLTNLSVLTDITASVPSFTVGTVISGSGTKPLVVRAAGPSLATLGVPGTIGDPKLDLFAAQTVVGTNDNWNGDSQLAAAMASVGAFPYVSNTSTDAAYYNAALPVRDYTVVVSGVGGATGTAIAEIYDATPAGSFTTSTPRLINVSVLKSIGAGGSLTLGFTLGGATARTVLIRVIGPGLAAFGLTSGTLGDPQLTLFNSASVAIATNDDWGADAQLTAAGARVSAFSVGNAPTKDAMLITTLPAGGYTARANGAAGTSGLAIVEVYEVP